MLKVSACIGMAVRDSCVAPDRHHPFLRNLFCDARTLGAQRQQLPGEADPPLYDVWGSSYKAMDEFGIGVGLYYRQLLTFAIVRLHDERFLCLAPVACVVGCGVSRTCVRLMAVSQQVCVCRERCYQRIVFTKNVGKAILGCHVCPSGNARKTVLGRFDPHRYNTPKGARWR